MPGSLMIDIACAARRRKIAVTGSGYVGLTLSASLALLGHEVECTDKSIGRIAELTTGHVPIVEDVLATLTAELYGRTRGPYAHAEVAE
jgi:UDP-glucose 6-dehydrogenase